MLKTNIKTISDQRAYWIQALYLGLLLFATLSHGTTFQILYFTLPLSSLCFPILFLLAAILAEVSSLRSTIKYLLSCSVLNLIITLLILNYFDQAMHEFWMGGSNESSSIYGLLFIGFHLGLFSVLVIATLGRRKVGGLYSFIKVSLSAMIANAVDIILIWPALFSSSEDTYLSSWKFLTLTMFKINILLVCLPVGWLILWYVLPHPTREITKA